MGDLERRIRWRHSVLDLALRKVNVWSKYVKLGQIFNFEIFLQKYTYRVQFCHQKCNLFLLTTKQR